MAKTSRLTVTLLCGLALGVSAASAHLAVSTRSLRGLIQQSDLVILARPVGQEEVVTREGAHEGRRPVLKVEVLKVLKGPDVRGVLRFAQHGHGVAVYQPGEEALLFLRDLSKSRELRALASTTRLKWYSNQEHDDDYVLRPASRKTTLEAANAYIDATELPQNERMRELRRVTVKMLKSRDRRLAESALTDLILAADTPLITRGDVPALIGVVQDRKTSIGVRVALLSELQRRGLVDGGAQWVRLLRSTRGADRLVVIRATGTQQNSEVDAELVTLMSEADDETAAAAAIALGRPGNHAAVVPLSVALTEGDRRVATAAVRALGGVGTSEARQALHHAATSHPNESIRRRAAAELRLFDSRSK